MSIFRYELVKIFRRRAVQITLLAFFFVNLFNLMATCELPDQTDEGKAYFVTQQKIIHSMEGPLTDETTEQIVAYYHELKNGEIEPKTQWDMEIYSQQISVFQELYDYQLRAKNLQTFIANRLTALKNGEHTYEIRRLKLMRKVYSARAITGYYDLTAFDERLYYGGYNFSSLLAVLLLLIGVTPLFSAEHECGMDVLLKASRRGRHHTIWCKLLAAMAFAAFGGILLFATDLIFYQKAYPFDLWHASLFAAPSFHNTPLNLTVGGFILLNWAIKILGLWVATLVIALISAIVRRTYFTFFFGTGYLLSMMVIGERLLLLNPLSLMSFATYAKDFSTVNVLGFPVLTIVALPTVMLALAGVLILLIHWVGVCTEWRLHWWLPKCRWICHTRTVRSGGGEWRKQLVKQRLLAVIVLLVMLKVFFGLAGTTYQYFSLPSQRAEYEALIETYGGEPNEKMTIFFEEEIRRVAADKETIDRWIKALRNGEITEQEYAALRSGYETQARVSPEVWKLLSKEYAYISADSVHRWLADVRGWKMLLENEAPDMLAILLVVLIGGVGFSYEWESGMADTLRTSRYGRRWLAWRKIAVSALCTIGIGVLFEWIPFAFAAGRYEMLAYWNYPLQTLNAFADFGGSIHIGQAYLLSRLIRLLGLLVVQAMSMAIAAGTKRSLTSVFTAMALTIIPYFLLNDKGALYTLPTPAGLLVGSGFFTLPVIAAEQWAFFSVAVTACLVLPVVAAECFSRKKRGGRIV